MDLHFTIVYKSLYGENLFIRFFDPRGVTEALELPMTYKDHNGWEFRISSNELPFKGAVEYQVIKRQGNAEVHLFPKRYFSLKGVKTPVVFITDEVQKGVNYLNAAGLWNIVKKRSSRASKVKHPKLVVQVWLPELNADFIPCITGSSKWLNKWNDAKPRLMQRSKNSWILEISPKNDEPFEFKVGLYYKREKKIVDYEKGENRVFENSGNDLLSILNITPDLSLPYWKGTGVNFPLSCLRTEQTWGCGDFSALRSAGKWCKKAGIRMIQLLPLNDTTATFTDADSYPYAPVSAFALHPAFMDVELLCRHTGYEPDEETKQAVKDLNNSNTLKLNEVTRLKFSVLRKIYEREMHTFRDDFAWFTFFDLHREWLQPYAAFCYLRDYYGTPDFNKWKQHSEYDESEVEELVSPDNIAYEEAGFYYFIQFHLHLQLADTVSWLHKQGIVLKGDLPIGVCRNSVETWMYPHYFKLNFNCGAPPDAFTQSGQNWGFPVYNWQEMEKDGYSWWRKRFEHLELFFDAIRIDHVIGLFRIWAVPVKSKEAVTGIFDPVIAFNEDHLRSFGITQPVERLSEPFNNDTSDVILLKDENGLHFRINMHLTESYKALNEHEQFCLRNAYNDYFFNRQNRLWEEEGRKRLAMFRNFTGMLLCAEDLGMVPAMVESVLSEMEILNLRVERMPVNNDQFFSTSKATYLTVVTPGTHDMSPLREWWKEPDAPVQWYYNYHLHSEGPVPETLDSDIAKKIIENHLASDAMWAVFLLQDLIAMSEELKYSGTGTERINDPANADHHWNYRIHLNTEELIWAKDFNKSIKTLNKKNGR